VKVGKLEIMKKTAATTITMMAMLSMPVARAETLPIAYNIAGPTVVESGKDVEISITIPNNTTHSIMVPKLAEASNNIHVTGPMGLTPPETEYGLEVNGKKPGAGNNGRFVTEEIKPMDKVKLPCVISKIYNMTSPGVYVVWAERYAPGSYTTLISNQITVTVTK